ncbi:MAG: ribokinase [Myxococcota bacterium]
MADIVVVGSLNLDVSVRAEHLPRPGETVRASGLELGPGGKGLNQALAAARLGGRVQMVGSVGEDFFSQIPLAALREAGIDTAHIASLEDEHTGTALISVDAQTGQNAISVAAGANRLVTPDQVRDAEEAFESSCVVLVQLELPLQTVETALELGRRHSLTTVLDPAPFRELPDSLLQKVDILTPNETEAESLSGRQVSDVDSGAAAGALLRARSGGDVIVTLGEQGCVWVHASGFEHVPAPAVEPVDTTGAGDAFNGGLAVALANGKALRDALDDAVRAGSAATLRVGAGAAMPTPQDVARLAGAPSG